MNWSSLFHPELVHWFRKYFPSAREAQSRLPRPSLATSNMAQWLSPSVKSREAKETRALFCEAQRLAEKSPFRDEDRLKAFMLDLITDICATRNVAPSTPLGSALWDAIAGFMIAEGFVLTFKKDGPREGLTLEEAHELRKILRRQIKFVQDSERLLPLFRHKLKVSFAGMLQHLPPSAFVDVADDGTAMDDSIVFPEAKALVLCEDFPEVVERSFVTFFDEDVQKAQLFESVRDRLEVNLRIASGIVGAKQDGKPIFPTANSHQDPEYLLDTYLGGTPLRDFFRAGLPFAIPFPAQFEHTHIIGGTGHGKTQLMQFLIHHDLVRAREDNRSVIVMDSQGDLIRTISRLGYFGFGEPGSLSDRFVLIDPTDVEHPVALNMFDFNRSRLSGYAPLDQEKILNATVELYEYFFGALLGAELTQRQGLIFRYLARLLIEIPGATIHTLRELMEDGEKFLPYMEKLEGTTRAFFATRFFDSSFRETKKQILSRLWGVLGNTALERMFSHKESKIDLFDMMNSGKIVFINTAKDLLGQDGAAIFGRFFVALITQAAVQRSAIPAYERNPCFLYLDEAQEYFDRNIGNLLTQARKYKVGLVFAHQSLDQLGTELRASVLANTTIKFVGGVSAKDAAALAPELRTDAEFLRAQERGETATSFACHVRNFTGSAISVSIPLGFVERLPRVSSDDEATLLELNRAEYSAPPERVPPVPFTVGKKSEPKPVEERERARERSPEPRVESLGLPALDETPPPPRPKTASTPKAPSTAGRGGQEHKYLQNLVKGLAEERGFRATIEEQILGGDGEVDVSIVKGSRKIAFEISVTTGKDHELSNVEKCIAAGYTEIVLVGAKERHAKALAKFIEENLEEGHGATIRYTAADAVVGLLDELLEPQKPAESTVRGYTVRTTRRTLSPEEQAERRKILANVVAKSIARGKGGGD